MFLLYCYEETELVNQTQGLCNGHLLHRNIIGEIKIYELIYRFELFFVDGSVITG